MLDVRCSMFNIQPMSVRRAIPAIIAAGVLPPAGAEPLPVYQPYQPDLHTLHLWHLDEAGPPFKDDGTVPTALLGLINGATAAYPSLPGFGSAVHFGDNHSTVTGGLVYGPILLAKPELDLGPGDNVDHPFPIMGPDGAFTIEAIVRLDVLPHESGSLAADIVSMDDESDANRVFIFRIEKPGFLSFVPISGNSVQGGGLASLPQEGPHAVTTGAWFHVAVSYNGSPGSPHNLKLYWTRIGPGLEKANLIGSGTLTEDLSTALGDFAIGNTGKFNALGPRENFPGAIDEVRISGIAREPHDFFFIPPEARARAHPKKPHLLSPELRLMIEQVLVNGNPVPVPAAGRPLELGPGLHRLDFEFGFLPGADADPFAIKCRLDGMDGEWQPATRGMSLTWEMLDADDSVLTSTAMTASGASSGWRSDVLDARLDLRNEALFIPGNTRKIRVSFSSGTPDTTGTWIIDNLSLYRSGRAGGNLWPNGSFSEGERMNQITGIPLGWERRGSEPAIARVILRSNPALGLLDAEQHHSALWTSTCTLPVDLHKDGEIFTVSWLEAYNVIPGASLRATYLNVPPGSYTFRAIGVGGSPSHTTAQLILPISIRLPVWQRPWFLNSAILAGLAGTALLGFSAYRRRTRRHLASMALQHAVERDRTRIARDMHDDLGTRVTALTFTASFVRNALDSSPEKARQQILRLESSARDLVHAMEGLVWAVNPANDTLDHLASHLSAVAQELFRDSGARIRISIPTDLPPLPLRSDFRHHFALAVKESLHNARKHAGPCEVNFLLYAEDGDLVACVQDNGAGFDPDQPREGNGLANIKARFKELGGSFTLESEPGKGATARFRCALPLQSFSKRSHPEPFP